MEHNNRKVKIVVLNADATNVDADVLVIKYAQAHYGLDYIIAQKIARLGEPKKSFTPLTGNANYFSARGGIYAKNILVVGVKSLLDFSYSDIRRFSRTALEELQTCENSVEHIILTLHGVGFGLDEIEAFESEVAGLIDAITSKTFPTTLKKISIVELDMRRAKQLTQSLTNLIPKGYIEVNLEKYLKNVKEDVSEKFRSVGYSSSDKPHIFVAMSFQEEMADIYDYGIQNAVRGSGFLCERADLSSFTGDVMEWVKKRIKSSALVVADLTNSNANVYLEVGYAWGAGIPTVLLVQEADHLKFDVKGQRCIVYERIKDLEHKLKIELIALKKK